MTRSLARLTFLLLLTLGSSALAQPLPSPSEHLKINVGADRVLADYHQITSYFEMLDERSARVQLEDLGATTNGNRMIMAVISSEENIRNLARLREISARLADPRGLSDEEIARLAAEGKAVVVVTCNIHSTEIASSQMAMEWAHALASATDPATLRRLDDVVLLLVPSLNPDGQILITDWYRQHVGTELEGGPMPWLYHHYVGHDNNRDWFMLTQKETRALSQMLYHRWHPQVFVDEHQMGSQGPRMFIPPFADPMDPDVHPLIWREINLIGSNMAYRLEQAEKPGLIWGYSFDAYWMGGTRNTGWWKNVTGLLLEVASARIASPVYVDPTELRGGRKGLVEYGPQINHPNPWRGGWWRMRDIMDYELIASDALLEIASKYREDLLEGVATRARAATEMDDAEQAYYIPRAQRDYPTATRLAQLLADHGVDVLRTAGGDYWIPLAQPYSRFVRELMEPQRYPEVKLVEGRDILSPYDVSTWTLPAMMGVQSSKRPLPDLPGATPLPSKLAEEDRRPVTPRTPTASWTTIDGASPEAARAVNAALATRGVVRFNPATATWWMDRTAAAAALGEADAALVQTAPAKGEPPTDSVLVRRPRVGIYKPWNASMDEGWTRWLLEQYGFEPVTLDNAAIRAGAVPGSAGARKLAELTAIILPSINPAVITHGSSGGAPREGARDPFPPQYRGGIGVEGTVAIRNWVDAGGTLIAFDAATEWARATLNLPVRNALAGTSSSEFNSAGALLRAQTHGSHFVTAGMPRETAVFLDSAIAFETSTPTAGPERTVLVSYPDDERDLLVSGWIRGGSHLERRAAAVAWNVGKGKAVAFGFRPQHRAQTHATFPLLFHSIWWSGVR